ncbi:MULTISPECIES: YpbS family protein [Paenibacillus]|uniref:YpbS family protein n=1 Tax=Paenibacillus chondroitinus TaxID=59842 RepID=A0ABU6DLX5_9BACL|nr:MULTISPECIES: YpbS family protein [Paenibacillus]MCY9662103.1 YpbS family protein [Paenibacillus anseongense]MEB4798320.1 YpbS family protein [Paenibacillus chondroitinus]
MNVHEAITKHSNAQHLHLVRFAELDAQRESAIDAAVELCKSGQPFTVDAINAVTAQIIAHAKEGISPLRSYVTEDMVRDYVNKG